MKRAPIFISLLSATLIGAGCSARFRAARSHQSSPNPPTPTVTWNLGKILSSRSLSQSDKVNTLVQSAERLITPNGFSYADQVLDQALILEPDHTKARFLKSLLKPLMSTRGSLRRLAPLALKLKRSSDLESFANSLPVSSFKSFLNTPASNDQLIQTEIEAQKIVLHLRDSWDDLRRTIQSLKTREIQLTFDLGAWSANRIEVLAGCAVTQKDKLIFELQLCPQSSYAVFNLGQADLELLQQAAAGMVVASIFGSSYSADGLISVIERLTDQGVQLTDQRRMAIVREHPNLGRLNGDNGLSRILDMGTDLIAGAKWLIKNQVYLCSTQTTPTPRPDYLFSGGICLDPKRVEPGSGLNFEQILSLTEVALRGPLTQTPVQLGSTQHQITVDGFKLFSVPVSDLKDLLPVKFDVCGNSTEIPDPTLGGVFPDADGALRLEQAGALRRACP